MYKGNEKKLLITINRIYYFYIFHVVCDLHYDNALLIREATTQRTPMEKWIGYEEEGSLIPRGRGTPYMIEGSEL